MFSSCKYPAVVAVAVVSPLAGTTHVVSLAAVHREITPDQELMAMTSGTA